jgi:mannose-1-phosphate guanylyltransferase
VGEKIVDRYAVILAGGGGTRFWPLSRRLRPKQLLALGGGPHSLLRQTAERLFPMFAPDHVFVVTAADQAAQVREELEILPPENIIDEPAPRDTAAAVALFAAFIGWRQPDSSFCVLPADHFVHPAADFQEALGRAFEAALTHHAAVTFGVAPDRPATQYGYMRQGAPVAQGVFEAKEFREKPGRAVAETLLKQGGWLWNSGMFVWRTPDLLDAVRRHLPQHRAMIDSLARVLGTSQLPSVLASEYEKLPKISIDHGIMEKVDRALVIPASFRWNDIGTWSSVRATQATDEQGNVIGGNVVALDARRSVVLSDDDHLIGVFGIDDLVVIHTPDATLVCPADRAEELKKLIARLQQEGKDQYL